MVCACQSSHSWLLNVRLPRWHYLWASICTWGCTGLGSRRQIRASKNWRRKSNRHQRINNQLLHGPGPQSVCISCYFDSYYHCTLRCFDHNNILQLQRRHDIKCRLYTNMDWPGWYLLMFVFSFFLTLCVQSDIRRYDAKKLTYGFGSKGLRITIDLGTGACTDAWFESGRYRCGIRGLVRRKGGGHSVEFRLNAILLFWKLISKVSQSQDNWRTNQSHV